MAFHHECGQQTTVVLATPVTSLSKEISVIFYTTLRLLPISQNIVYAHYDFEIRLTTDLLLGSL